jgi:hypothetical protein
MYRSTLLLQTLLKTYAPVLVSVVSFFSVNAQDIQVKGVKDKTAIPQACESIVPANLKDEVDVKALVKESNCKGSGDMMSDYTYVVESVKREPGNKGQIKEEIIVYEVFMPNLPNGARGRGVLLVTSRDGVPVPPQELEKKRLQAGERLEKEEKRVASVSVSQTAAKREGMLPLGSYGKFTFGIDKAVVDVHTYLTNCELTLIRREQNEGREMLVLAFTPQPDARFKDNEKYIAQLKGEIWIDVKDRIVTRLVGWPQTATQLNQNVPAVYFEMIRLPTGVWLPHVTRINGAHYPGLFDHIKYYSTLTFSEYKRFSTEIKDQRLEVPR